MPTTSMNIRMDDDVKCQAQALFSEFGMDMDTAINIFLRQTVRERAIPFAIEMVPERQPTDDDKFFSGANMEHLRHSLAQAQTADAMESKKAFERLMRYKGTLPADFDYKAELAAARSEKYENIG
jgi:DNA-damage-inducible protein J